MKLARMVKRKSLVFEPATKLLRPNILLVMHRTFRRKCLARIARLSDPFASYDTLLLERTAKVILARLFSQTSILRIRRMIFTCHACQIRSKFPQREHTLLSCQLPPKPIHR